MSAGAVAEAERPAIDLPDVPDIATLGPVGPARPLAEGGCAQAFPALLRWNLVLDCARADGHTGKHKNAAGDTLWWGEKLSESDTTAAAQLRALGRVIDR